ncbi:MAG TPA: hypothetical protein VHE54_11535 [Puia sp.]|nr:hypothetical protein [Puia sp.]
MKSLVLLLLCLMARSQKQAADPPPHFIAMEYKGMSNCIYKVYVTDSLILGARVNGYISVQNGFGIGKTVPRDRMHDPEAYVDRTMDRYDLLLSDHDAFLSADKDNFIIQKSEIKRVYHDPKKKWGMGYYPHAGKIEIQAAKTRMNRHGNRELILVGDQDPDRILSLFNSR